MLVFLSDVLSCIKFWRDVLETATKLVTLVTLLFVLFNLLYVKTRKNEIFDPIEL